jgi:carbon storage regulator
MLVLTRRVGESICVGQDVVVTVVHIGPGKVRIGIKAPGDALVLREELVDRSPAPPPVLLGSTGVTEPTRARST